MLNPSSDINKLIDETLHFMSQLGWKEKRHEFFNTLVFFLGEKLGVEYALVDELLPDAVTAKTLGVYAAGQIIPDIEYSLKGTPCENVMGKTLCSYPANIQNLFPEDKLLVDMGAESYVGIPLWSTKGEAIGLVAIMGKTTLANPQIAEAILQLVATRCAHELEQQRDERKIMDKNKQLRQLFDEATYGIALADPETGVITDCNSAFAALLKRARREIIGRPQREFHVDEEQTEGLSSTFRQHLGEQSAVTLESRMLTGSGEIIDVEIKGKLIDLGGQKLVQGFFKDVTARKRSEAELRDTEERYRAIVTAFDGLIYICSHDYKIQFMNDKMIERTGRNAVGEPCFKALHDLDATCPWCVNNQLYLGEPVRWEVQSPKDGRWYYVVNTPIQNTDGSISKQAMIEDITERKRSEEALRRSDELLRSCQSITRAGGWEWHIEHQTMIWTEETYRLHDIAEGEISPGSWEHIKKSLSCYNPEDRQIVLQAFKRCVERGESYDLELPFTSLSGRKLWVRTRAQAIREEGRIVKIVGNLMDTTEIKKVEDERLELERQLNHAQKIESIGQLAGGVAHDFNNMLGVILGHAELALRKADPASPFISDLEGIRTAANRSADLTRQLLTFARKQIIAPKRLDLNEAVAGTLKMLQRLIGENIHLSWNPAVNLWPVKIDPTQMDQILANLCVNARDAISGIGTITIKTANMTFDAKGIGSRPYFVEPGDYVQLSVSDDGCGMAEEVQPRIFEPFYSTKKIGSGTGLGLSTVYGAVKQNQGFLTVYSEPGLGTVFNIYLPREKTSVPTEAQTPAKVISQGTETILLVEDDEMLLDMEKSMLEEGGYRVLAAATTDLAQSLARDHPGPIHLLISDMIMPVMNGRELSIRLQPLRPEMKVLFLSGYTAEVISTQGIIEEGIHFLQKPFSIDSLTAKAREVLDGP